jgi:hypothetical protein
MALDGIPLGSDPPGFWEWLLAHGNGGCYSVGGRLAAVDIAIALQSQYDLGNSDRSLVKFLSRYPLLDRISAVA